MRTLITVETTCPRTTMELEKLSYFLLIHVALFTMWSDAKPWSGVEKKSPHSYDSTYYRDKREDDDDIMVFDDEDDEAEITGYDDDTGDRLIDYYSDHDLEDKNLHKAFNDWFKITQQEKMSRLVDPFHLDMYRIQMSKPPPRSRRRLLLPDRSNVRRKLSRLSRIRSLQDRLRHIEEMKAALQQKIRELQRIKEKERTAQIRIENEVSKAERDWKADVDRFKPSFKPLVRLGDVSRLI